MGKVKIIWKYPGHRIRNLTWQLHEKLFQPLEWYEVAAAFIRLNDPQRSELPFELHLSAHGAGTADSDRSLDLTFTTESKDALGALLQKPAAHYEDRLRCISVDIVLLDAPKSHLAKSRMLRSKRNIFTSNRYCWCPLTDADLLEQGNEADNGLMEALFSDDSDEEGTCSSMNATTVPSTTGVTPPLSAAVPEFRESFLLAQFLPIARLEAIWNSSLGEFARRITPWRLIKLLYENSLHLQFISPKVAFGMLRFLYGLRYRTGHWQHKIHTPGLIAANAVPRSLVTVLWQSLSQSKPETWDPATIEEGIRTFRADSYRFHADFDGLFRAFEMEQTFAAFGADQFRRQKLVTERQELFYHVMETMIEQQVTPGKPVRSFQDPAFNMVDMLTWQHQSPTAATSRIQFTRVARCLFGRGYMHDMPAWEPLLLWDVCCWDTSFLNTQNIQKYMLRIGHTTMEHALVVTCAHLFFVSLCSPPTQLEHFTFQDPIMPYFRDEFGSRHLLPLWMLLLRQTSLSKLHAAFRSWRSKPYRANAVTWSILNFCFRKIFHFHDIVPQTQEEANRRWLLGNQLMRDWLFRCITPLAAPHNFFIHFYNFQLQFGSPLEFPTTHLGEREEFHFQLNYTKAILYDDAKTPKETLPCRSTQNPITGEPYQVGERLLQVSCDHALPPADCMMSYGLVARSRRCVECDQVLTPFPQHQVTLFQPTPKVRPQSRIQMARPQRSSSSLLRPWANAHPAFFPPRPQELSSSHQVPPISLPRQAPRLMLSMAASRQHRDTLSSLVRHPNRRRARPDDDEATDDDHASQRQRIH